MARQRAEVRREMKRVLANLDPRWMRAASNEVAARLSQLLDGGEMRQRPDRVLAWASFVAGAPDLAPFISEQLNRREVFLGRYSPDGELLFLKIDVDKLDPETSPYAREGGAFHPDLPGSSVLLVPGMAFDRLGGRLGRGDDFYIRFCHQLSAKHIVKIGVCWSFQVVADLPIDGDDISVDWLCTEEETVRIHDVLEHA